MERKAKGANEFHSVLKKLGHMWNQTFMDLTYANWCLTVSTLNKYWK